MRFLFEEGEEVKEQYKTAISDARWIAYDIPGNVGWIAYLVCVFLGLREKKDSYNIASALPGVLMLIGVGELISERIAGLDRVLSGKRLFRGFGALTAGGLLGIPMAILGLKRSKKRAAAIDEDRKRNAELFEEAFYGKKNLNPKMDKSAEEKTVRLPEGLDAELLGKVLVNPEMVALLSSLAENLK